MSPESAEQSGKEILGLRRGRIATATSAAAPPRAHLPLLMPMRLASDRLFLQYSDDVERFMAWRPEGSVVTAGRA